jgi:hypothetical protein
MCVCFIESKIAICLLSAATHSIQSQKPSNFQMHQEEDFQATHLKKKKKKSITAGPITKQRTQKSN